MEIVIFILFGLVMLLHVSSILRRAFVIRNYDPPEYSAKPMISLVVCSRNEKANLMSLLPLLYQQTYQNFEIILVLDGDDGSFEWLQGAKYENLRIIRIGDLEPNFHPKKYGITMAIDQAKGEWILVTDADCRPKKNWITEMAKGMHESKEIVLGVSPYIKTNGILNLLIQYETFQTAYYFVSSALNQRAYMGLGRNLAYRKDLFFAVDGFNVYAHVTGGDDDLLIQSMLKDDNYSVVLTTDSRVDSFPKHNWRDFIIQKTRHFSVGKYYPEWVKKMEAIRWLIHSLFWILFAVALFHNFRLALPIFILGLLVKAISINIAADRLEKRFNPLWLPFVDLLYVVVLPLIGLRSLLVKRITWK